MRKQMSHVLDESIGRAGATHPRVEGIITRNLTIMTCQGGLPCAAKHRRTQQTSHTGKQILGINMEFRQLEELIVLSRAMQDIHREIASLY